MDITRRKREWIVQGRGVRLRLAEALNTWGMEVSVRRGRGWLLVCASDRNTPALKPQTLAGGPVLFEGAWARSFSQEPAKITKRKNSAMVLLNGGCGAHEIEQRVTVFDDEPRIHVHVTCRLHGRVRVAGLGAAWLFLPRGELMSQYERPDFAWLPTLRRSARHVVADQIFRAPAAIVQHGRVAVSLAPDLDVLAENRPLPACLDLTYDHGGVAAPILWYGFKPYKVDGHVYFQHAPHLAKPLKDAVLEFAYDLLPDGDAPERGAHRRAMRFLWNKHGSPLIRKLPPQTAPFDTFARHAASFAFHTGAIYHEFDIGGRTCAGVRTTTTAARTTPRVMNGRELAATLGAQKLVPFLHNLATTTILNSPLVNDISELSLHASPPPATPMCMNQAWMCNLRTAYGLYAHAHRWNDTDMAERALKIKETLLNAPMNNGLWPSVCFFPHGRVFWHNGSKAFQTSDYYHLPDNAWTGVWMLRWYKNLEQDARLLERARAFGDFLVTAQLEDGAIPPWVKFRAGKLVSKNTLRQSAQTAAPGMFLSRLAVETGDKKYLDAARKAAEFITHSVMPENLWFDYETFFSCSKKGLNMRDTGTGLPPMNNLCVYWSSEMFRWLFELTGEDRYIEAGLNVLDLLCLWQQVWDAPYVSINTFGGFGVMNTDAEWNDARQSMFAECLMRYFLLTGEPEYFERGVAALRASFTLMLAPENRTVAPGNLGRLRKSNYGATYENYAHLGFDRRVPGYVMFDWGSGGALAAAARTRSRFGDVFIHAPTGSVFGIDFCTASGLTISKTRIAFTLKKGGRGSREFIVKTHGLDPGQRELVINKKSFGKFSRNKLEQGVTITL